MKEIGSEFWLEHSNSIVGKGSFNKLIDFGNDKQLLYTGRTAIDYVLEDIKESIRSVYMPAYCCSSMLQPFYERGIDIKFYEVTIENNEIVYDINFEKDIDIFFANSYFGYSSSTMDDIINAFKIRNKIIIEDITHRLLNKNNHSGTADYYIASLRKWFAIPSGGLAIKQHGNFKKIPLFKAPDTVINKKIRAMHIKREYMNTSNNSIIKKSDFLELFAEFNNSIKSNYKYLMIDDLSRGILREINITELKKKRKENVKYIYDNLEVTRDISFLIEKPEYDDDCLLFLPLIIKNDVRAKLREYLISKSIYCPVHWPIPTKAVSKQYNTELYQQELSLVCDHRYGLYEMDKIVKMIGEFQSTL